MEFSCARCSTNEPDTAFVLEYVVAFVDFLDQFDLDARVEK
jgi:hypothetical protein